MFVSYVLHILVLFTKFTTLWPGKTVYDEQVNALLFMYKIKRFDEKETHREKTDKTEYRLVVNEQTVCIVFQ